ncbi:MAG: DUF1624 domain-containing protein [Oscillospiraceae bacterium]|nr:DUF1624 domain-containing protein [Oscillospiraceae bacterium]
MNLKNILQSKPIPDRCHLLDTLRGLTVINMVLFHAVWDLVYIFGMKWNWYHGQDAYLWQQGICWSFILLSGFCSGMSRHLLRRGLTVFGLGAGITLITALFMPENLILFGVLTLIGSCMLLMAGCRKFLQKIPAMLGIFVNFILFAFTKHVNSQFLGIFSHELFSLPSGLYRNYLTAYLGFPQKGFYSTDYFSLIPWLFLFLTGFFIYQASGQKILNIKWKGISFLNFIGRHALEIYALHQPVIYGILWICFR